MKINNLLYDIARMSSTSSRYIANLNDAANFKFDKIIKRELRHNVNKSLAKITRNIIK